MAETFGEWRRAASPCAGALILWLRDLAPGAGWGVLDHRARPKAALAHLRRALAPVAVWITDEGLSGMTAHIANDRAAEWTGALRVALYRDGELLVEQARVEVSVAPHAVAAHDLEAVIGRFVDIGWTYRFGAPGQDLVVASLETGAEPGEGILSQAFRFPVGRPLRRETAAALGLEATVATVSTVPAVDDAPAGVGVTLRSRRVVHGLRIDAPGWRPADDALTLEPGVARHVVLVRAGANAGGDDGSGSEGADGDGAEVALPRTTLTALNLADRVRAATA
jgi:beta-mannosidase